MVNTLYIAAHAAGAMGCLHFCGDGGKVLDYSHEAQENHE